MLRRWTLAAYPVITGDRAFDTFSQAMADAANADPGVFWTERGARRAARFHTQVMGLPVALEAVRRTPTTYPCACGCDRRFLASAGWDGYHGPAA